jgi:hypothetical protein
MTRIFPHRADTQTIDKFLAFMEPHILLLCSQKSADGPYPEHVKSTLNTLLIFMHRSSAWIFVVRFSYEITL